MGEYTGHYISGKNWTIILTPSLLQGLRAQIDRDQYRRNMQAEVEAIERDGLRLFESSVEDIKIKDSDRGPQVEGVCLG